MADILYEKRFDDEYRGFLAQGELRLQCCSGCGTYRHPPRFACPRCLGGESVWKAVSGRGEVETFLWYNEPVDPRFSDVPYNVALVRLAEGPGVFANVPDAGVDDLAVGQAVTAGFGERDGRAMLFFKRTD